MRSITEKEKLKLSKSKLKYHGMVDGARKKIIYECPNHGRIEQRFDVHIKNLNCSKCSKLKDGIFTQKYIDQLISNRGKKYKYNIEDKTYTTRDKINIICDKHGTFQQKIHNHFYLNSNCPKCSKSKEIKLDHDVETLIESKNIKIIQYNGYRICSLFSCREHGEFKSKIETTKRHGCPRCAYNNKLARERIKFIKKSKKVWNDLIKFDYDSLIYNGSSKKMKLFSKATGWISQLPSNHLLGFAPKLSTGELIISNLLSSKNISFTKEMKFDGCVNIRRLRFDFYIPDINTCIEFNGVQHYKPISLFGGEEKYIYQVKNDNIKIDFCKKIK
jgi:phage FluMu protein Com